MYLEESEALLNIIYKDQQETAIKMSIGDIASEEFLSRAKDAGLSDKEIAEWIENNRLALEGKAMYRPFSLTPTTVKNLPNHD